MSSYLLTAPGIIATAAASCAGVGDTIRTADAAASAPSASLLAAAQDEVSSAIAILFGDYATEYQSLSKQATAFHTRFV